MKLGPHSRNARMGSSRTTTALDRISHAARGRLFAAAQRTAFEDATLAISSGRMP